MSKTNLFPPSFKNRVDMITGPVMDQCGGCFDPYVHFGLT